MTAFIETAISVLHILVTVGMPVALFALVISIVIQKFSVDLGNGIRSLSSVLLPIIFVTFSFVFNKEIFQMISEANVIVGFLSALIWGFLIILLLRFLPFKKAPISEFILAFTFAILVYSYVGQRQSGIMLSYYYGMTCGFLLHIVFLGVPNLSSSRYSNQDSMEKKS